MGSGAEVDHYVEADLAGLPLTWAKLWMPAKPLRSITSLSVSKSPIVSWPLPLAKTNRSAPRVASVSSLRRDRSRHRAHRSQCRRSGCPRRNGDDDRVRESQFTLSDIAVEHIVALAALEPVVPAITAAELLSLATEHIVALTALELVVPAMWPAPIGWSVWNVSVGAAVAPWSGWPAKLAGVAEPAIASLPAPAVCSRATSADGSCCSGSASLR